LQDLNHDPANPNTRLYATHEAQPYHNDSSDIVGKLLLFEAVYALNLAVLPPEDLLLQACWHAVFVMTGHTAQHNSIISHATAGTKSQWSVL